MKLNKVNKSLTKWTFKGISPLVEYKLSILLGNKIGRETCYEIIITSRIQPEKV